jgi:hypothetical protein
MVDRRDREEDAMAFAPRSARDRRDAPETEPAAAALIEIARCIAQILHEADPSVAGRLNFEAGRAYSRLMDAGQEDAAAIVYAFGRKLLDGEAFPEDTGEDDDRPVT